MRAITLWRPWPWAIFHAGKQLENRPRPHPWSSLVGQQVALHAGRTYDCDAHPFVREVSGLTVPYVHSEGVVGVCVVKQVVDRDSLRATACRKAWFTGPYALVLDDVIELPRPIPCRGYQGAWNLPPDVEAAVLAQLKPAP